MINCTGTTQQHCLHYHSSHCYQHQETLPSSSHAGAWPQLQLWNTGGVHQWDGGGRSNQVETQTLLWISLHVLTLNVQGVCVKEEQESTNLDSLHQHAGAGDGLIREWISRWLVQCAVRCWITQLREKLIESTTMLCLRRISSWVVVWMSKFQLKTISVWWKIANTTDLQFIQNLWKTHENWILTPTYMQSHQTFTIKIHNCINNRYRDYAICYS